MEVRDIGNTAERYKNWIAEVKEQGIVGLNLINSKLLIQHIEDLETGRNTDRKHAKGSRGFNTLLTRKVWLIIIFRNLEKRGIKDISKITEEQIHKYFDDVKKGIVKKLNGKGDYGKSIRDQIKAFNCFWHWWMRVNRKIYTQTNGKKGKMIPDITEELSAEKNGEEFVYFTFENLKQAQPYFTQDEQTLNFTLFDTIGRAPKEIMNIKVLDKHEDQLTIREETSKTYGRTIKLLLCSDALDEHIKRNNLKPGDYLFNFDPSNYNKKLKQVFKKVFGDVVTLGGEKYSNISLYDFRHSGAIHWRLGAYKSKIDALMYRGGWSNLNMLNHYTKKIGMKDSIEKSDLLIDVDKTELVKQKIEIAELKQLVLDISQQVEDLKNGTKTKSGRPRWEVLTDKN